MKYEQEIRDFFLSELKDNGFHEKIDGEISLIDSGILDSLGILVTISFLEEKYGIVIDKNDLTPNRLDSVNAIALFIGENGKNKVS